MAKIIKASVSDTIEVVLFTLDNGDVQGMSTEATPIGQLTDERILTDISEGRLGTFLGFFPADPKELTAKTLARASDWRTIYEA